MRMLIVIAVMFGAIFSQQASAREIGSQYDMMEVYSPVVRHERAPQNRHVAAKHHRDYVYASGEGIRSRVYDAHSGNEIVSHPSGCPARAFCGCGAAAYIGLHDRSLWLAANWLPPHFQRASPGPGMAAARRHHVMILLSGDLGGGRAMAYDANSGGGRTRIHEVSLRGYTVVDPRRARYAGI